MYGLINKIAAAPGRRDELMNLMLQGVDAMPGCRSYLVAADAADPNAIWVTEVWDSKEDHEASLAIPAVRSAIDQAMPFIAGFDSVATTQPAGGIGLR